MDSSDVNMKANILAGQIREYAIAHKAEATLQNNLAEILFADDKMQLARDPENLRWIFEMDDVMDCSIDDILCYERAEQNLARYQKEAAMAKKMYNGLVDMPKKDGYVNIALKRFREEWGCTYRVLAIFPEGSQIEDPDCKDGKVTQKNPGIIFYSAESPCVNHACDILYKQLRKVSIAKGYIPLTTRQEMFASIYGIGHQIEFMDEKTKETRDPSKFLSWALHGYISNEQRRSRLYPALLEE